MALDKGFVNIFTQLPTWAKGIIAVGVLGGIAYIGYKIIKKAEQVADTKYGKNDLSDVGSTLKELAKKGIKPQLTDGQLAVMAGTLRESFEGCMTNNDDIDNVFRKCTNEADVLSLIQKYGMRKYDACNWEFDFGDKEYTLPQALNSEGNTSRVNDVLRQKNIDFQF